MSAHDKPEDGRRMIYRGLGEGWGVARGGGGMKSGLDVYGLDEPVQFVPLSPFRPVTSVISAAPFLHSSARQLKPMPSREGGDVINIS